MAPDAIACSRFRPFGESYALPAYLATTVLSIAGTLGVAAPTASRLLRVVTAIATLAAVSVHALAWSDRMSDPIAVWVSATITVAAVAILVSALVSTLRGRRTTPPPSA